MTNSMLGCEKLSNSISKKSEQKKGTKNMLEKQEDVSIYLEHSIYEPPQNHKRGKSGITSFTSV